MPKSAERVVNIEVQLASTGFPKTLYFNRLRVDRDNEFCFIQFGLVVASELIDSYSCVVPNLTLQQNKETLLNYVNKLSSGDEDIIQWKGVTSARHTNLVDFFQMSFTGNESETVLHVLSKCALSAMKAESSAKVQSQPLALLRSSTKLQKQLITWLYEES